jgi:hypothetical protein
MQITQFLAHVQHEVQQCKDSTRGRTLPSAATPVVPLEANGIPVEDKVTHLQLELQVVQSRLLNRGSGI